ncbi:MAG: DUF503 domain-containing protein [Planctomycetota bacterium]
MIEVGILQITLFIRGAHSLKEKRKVVRSVVDRLRSRFNVSIAEVDDHDLWQKATIGMAAVASDSQHVRQRLESIVNYLYQYPAAELVDHQIDIL